jgi:2-polyprenyl-3-methyl-5-hydroxy-6-metoxy-1,4-benzoquinol methylase
VDILDLAIEKLYANADEYGVTSNICGIVKSIDDYQIKERNYDLVMAVSSLEHVDSKETFVNKLQEIEHGIRKNGIVCLVVNSNIKEFDKKTGNEILPQFEVCLPTEEMQRIFEKAFSEWTVLKSTVVDQQYDIPRDSGICELKTSVVTFVAKKG